MAVHRTPPICPYCGKNIDAIVDNQLDLPPQLRLIGDNFISWDWEKHYRTCEHTPKKSFDGESECFSFIDENI